MSKELKITVSGSTNTGKTTVCYLIKKCLAEKGIEVEFDGGVDYDEDKFDNIVSENLNEKVEAISKNVQVNLKEVQTQKSIPSPLLSFEDNVSENKTNRSKITMGFKEREYVIFTFILLIVGVPMTLFTDNQWVLMFFLFAGLFIGARYSHRIVNKFWKVK